MRSEGMHEPAFATKTGKRLADELGARRPCRNREDLRLDELTGQAHQADPKASAEARSHPRKSTLSEN